MPKPPPSGERRNPTVSMAGLICAAAAACLVLSELPVQASVACDPAAAMPQEAVEALARDPVAILRRHADVRGLAEEVQAIVMSGQPGRFAVLAAARTATSAQQEQIGRGIGRAYRSCLKSANSSAEEIRDRVLRSDVTRLNAAFQDEVDALWTNNSAVTVPPERPMDDIGTAPSEVFPSTDLTALDGPFALPPLPGPLPNPFEPIK